MDEVGEAMEEVGEEIADAVEVVKEEGAEAYRNGEGRKRRMLDEAAKEAEELAEELRKD